MKEPKPSKNPEESSKSAVTCDSLAIYLHHPHQCSTDVCACNERMWCIRNIKSEPQYRKDRTSKLQMFTLCLAVEHMGSSWIKISDHHTTQHIQIDVRLQRRIFKLSLLIVNCTVGMGTCRSLYQI